MLYLYLFKNIFVLCGIIKDMFDKEYDVIVVGVGYVGFEVVVVVVNLGLFILLIIMNF